MTYNLVQCILPALYCACSGSRPKGHQWNFHFYSLNNKFPFTKKIYPIELITKQDKSIARLKIRIQHRDFSLHSLSLNWDRLYSFERSTLFTTTILKIILFHNKSFEKYTLTLFTTTIFTLLKRIFLSISHTYILLKRVSFLHKALS